MQLWSRLKSLARNLLRKSAAEGELDEELQSYAETITEEKIAAGMSPSEARRTALADLGGLEQVKQSVRDRRTGITLELLWQDVRYALRQLARNRAFTLTAVLTLALGIGATTAIFSAVYTLLLRPLPYPDADRLVFMTAKSPVMNVDPLLSQDFVAAQTSVKSFWQIAGYNFHLQNLTGAGDPIHITSSGVTANLFPLLGVVPQLGRLFTSQDDRPDGPLYVVLSNRLWRAQFHADPQIVGKTLSLDGKQQIIIGVLSQRFSFPDLTLEPDLYRALDLPRDTSLAAAKVSYGVSTIALLRPGVSTRQAQAESQNFFLSRAHAAPPVFARVLAGRHAEVMPLQRHIAGDNRQSLLILLACVGAVLLQLPFGKLSAAFQSNVWVLIFTIGLALLTTLLFGLAPAITGTRLDLRSALQSAAMRISQGREQRFVRHGLLVIEVALAVILLASAGLVIRSFVNVMRCDSGFDPSNTLTGATLLYSPRYAASEQATRNFISDLLTRLGALPGVQSAAVASALPLQHVDSTSITFGPPMPPPPIAARPSVPVISVSSNYFRVIGSLILRGRAFAIDDNATAPPVAIVNQAFAKRYFSGNAVGKQFNRFTGSSGTTPVFTPVTIVGIAEDIRHNGLEQQVQPEFYLPESQSPSTDINIALRSTADPTFLANAMRKAVLAVDPQQPLFDIQTMDQRISAQVAQRRLIMLLIACFAALAVILSAVGVCGVFAYSVSQRTQEMGIRLALGASRQRLLGLIVAQAARLIALGGVLGLGGAFLLSRLLTSMLVGVQPHDALSFSLAWMLMTAIALLASTIPASHATRTNLVSVLHSE